MNSRANRLARLAGLAAALALVLCSGAGCAEPTARLWADTALPDGAMSTQSHQWAYGGETVTFELDCQPGSAQYVVFGIEGEETVVKIAKVAGKYRWTHVFAAGPKPHDIEVYARPFLIRDKCDYVYDKLEDKWYYYPGSGDKPDVQTCDEQTMTITVYRVELRLEARGAGRPAAEDLAGPRQGRRQADRDSAAPAVGGRRAGVHPAGARCGRFVRGGLHASARRSQPRGDHPGRTRDRAHRRFGPAPGAGFQDPVTQREGRS